MELLCLSLSGPFVQNIAYKKGVPALLNSYISVCIGADDSHLKGEEVNACEENYVTSVP